MTAIETQLALSLIGKNAQVVDCGDERLWLGERKKGVGASESPVLFGPDVTPHGSPFGMWAEKTGQVEPAPVVSDAAKWGRYLEAPIADAYAEETGRPLVDLGRRTLLRSRRLPYMQATLDRVINFGSEIGPLEIKNVGAHKLDEWVEAPPLRYQVQLQHQLAVTGFAMGALAVLVGGQKFIRFDVERDDKFISALEELCGDFWQCVETRTPPAVDGSDATRRAIERLYTKDNGESVVLGEEFLSLDRDLQAIEARIDDLESQKKELRNRIVAAIGPASRGVIPNGPAYTFKLVEKKAHEVKASSYRQLRRVAAK